MPWQETPEGANLNTAYDAWRNLWNVQLPGHKQNLLNLKERPIKG